MDLSWERLEELHSALTDALGAQPPEVSRALASIQALGDTVDPRAAMVLLLAIWPRVRWSTPNPLLPLALHRPALVPVEGPSVPVDVRAAAEVALQRFVHGLPVARLPHLDHHIRGLGRKAWSVVMLRSGRTWIEYAWVVPPTPGEVSLGPGRIAQLCLMACHADGHIREAAIAALAGAEAEGADAEAALRLLLLRSVDWVAPVARRAAQAALARLAAAPSNVLLRTLPLVSALARGERPGSRRFVADAFALLATPERREVLRAALSSPDRRVSRAAAQVVDAAAVPPSAALVRSAAGCLDAVTRSRAMAWETGLREADPQEAAALRQRFLSDPATRIRAAALRMHLEVDGPAMAAGDGTDGALRAALFDPAASVRWLAAYHLREALGRDGIADLYRAEIAKAPPPGRLAAAAAGLGEVGNASDVSLLWPLVAPETPPRVARAALRSLAALDRAGTRPALLELLADPRPGVQREALHLLDRRLDDSDADRLAALWTRGTAVGRQRLAAAMLRLPPWRGLDLLLQVARTHPALADATLQRWKAETRRGYAPPRPPADLAQRLRASLDGVAHWLGRETAQRIDRELSHFAGA